MFWNSMIYHSVPEYLDTSFNQFRQHLQQSKNALVWKVVMVNLLTKFYMNSNDKHKCVFVTFHILFFTSLSTFCLLIQCHSYNSNTINANGNHWTQFKIKNVHKSVVGYFSSLLAILHASIYQSLWIITFIFKNIKQNQNNNQNKNKKRKTFAFAD